VLNLVLGWFCHAFFGLGWAWFWSLSVIETGKIGR